MHLFCSCIPRYPTQLDAIDNGACRDKISRGRIPRVWSTVSEPCGSRSNQLAVGSRSVARGSSRRLSDKLRDHPRCAGRSNRSEHGGRLPRLQSIENRSRQPVLWVPPTAPESAIKLTRSGAEQRARTTAAGRRRAAPNGTSGALHQPDCRSDRTGYSGAGAGITLVAMGIPTVSKPPPTPQPRWCGRNVCPWAAKVISWS
jgi:hypothetical protein